MRNSFLLKKQPKILKNLGQLPASFIMLILLISALGIVMMYSAAQGNLHPWAYKQLIHIAVFFPIMILIAIIDIRFWFRVSYIAYIGVLLLLVLIEIFGHTAMGATRWINLGFIRLQPSELMKICMVLALAKYFHSVSYTNVKKISYLFVPLIITMLPFALIVKQPDLGTGLILLASSGMIFFAAGVQIWKFVAVLAVSGGVMPFIWSLLHEYQKKRILTFLEPESDPLGAGYNIIQSKIAIGSGGFFGKGILHGSQSQLDFLPEHQTDFIFTMIAEELGFAGGMLLLSLYSLVIIYCIFIAVNCRHHYGRMIAIGVTAVFFLHVFINMAMVMGLVPAVGVPLPLISYGGTIMMTMLIGFGLVLSVSLHSNVNISANPREII